MPLRDANEKRQMPPSNKRRASEGSVPQQEQDALYWKNMFESQNERVTQAEASLFAFSEESEKREKSLKSYIQHLENQVSELKEKVVKSEKEEEEMERMRETVDMQTKTIALHECLTGTTLSNVDASKDVSCDCKVTNQETKKTTEFRLSSSENETAMITYEPIGIPDSSLPDFLHTAIEFESSQTPGLVQIVLKGMFPDEE